jgi:beta-galactosidase
LAYVRNGGHLLLGPRSGMKDEFNSLNPQRQPGPLADALGGTVEQYYALEQPVGLVGDGQRNQGQLNREGSKADTWAERLSISSPDTAVDLTYGQGNGWLDGKPAMITRAVGKGSISLLGTLPDKALMSAILREAIHSSGAWVNYGRIPDSVEFCMRQRNDQRVVILINHDNAASDAILYGHYRSLLPEPKLSATFLPTSAPATSVELPAQGVAVLVPEPAQ